MSKAQGVYCFGMSLSGALAMFMFGSAFSKHYPYFGYEGDMDEAAASCYRTAVVFLVLAVASVALFFYASAKDRMATSSSSSRKYEAL